MLLILTTTIALEGFAEIFSKFLFLPYISPLIISLVLGFTGLILGVVFYYLSFIQKRTNTFIGLLIPVVLIILLLSTFFLFGPRAYINLVVSLLKLIFILILCLTPTLGTYGILKNKKTTVFSATGGIIFFFFFSKIFLANSFDLLINKTEVVILFFISIICLLELNSTTTFFHNSSNKVSYSEDRYGDTLLFRFNELINNYVLYLVVVLAVCFLFTYFIYLFNKNFNVIFFNGMFGLEDVSNVGIWLFIIVLIVILLVLWLLFTSERNIEET